MIPSSPHSLFEDLGQRHPLPIVYTHVALLP